jgi:hypothetical protein
MAGRLCTWWPRPPLIELTWPRSHSKEQTTKNSKKSSKDYFRVAIAAHEIYPKNQEFKASLHVFSLFLFFFV